MSKYFKYVTYDGITFGTNDINYHETTFGPVKCIKVDNFEMGLPLKYTPDRHQQSYSNFRIDTKMRLDIDFDESSEAYDWTYLFDEYPDIYVIRLFNTIKSIREAGSRNLGYIVIKQWDDSTEKRYEPAFLDKADVKILYKDTVAVRLVTQLTMSFKVLGTYKSGDLLKINW